jgi:hypothetical protein
MKTAIMGITEELLLDILSMGAQVFESFGDVDDQIPASVEAYEKHISLHPKSFICKLDDSGELIGWAVAVPTSKLLAQKFLDGRITEKELFDETEPSDQYEALYLCFAFVIHKERKKHHARDMFLEILQSVPLSDDATIFTWPVSEDGEKFTKKFALEIDLPIHIRE